MRDNYLENLHDFEDGKLKKAKLFFAKHGYELEAAYCKLIDDDLKGAKQIFLRLRDSDLRADFGYRLVNILQSKCPDEYLPVEKLPRFFQLRNFLETDINLLIKYNKGDYVESLCKYSDILAGINSETYKYFSRVFFFNNYVDFALHFALKAKNYFYNDAELHYHLALIMLAQNDKENAINYCKSCLRIAEHYFPAENLLHNLAKI